MQALAPAAARLRSDAVGKRRRDMQAAVQELCRCFEVLSAAPKRFRGSLGITQASAQGDEITELASHIHAATCRWLDLVAEFDRRGGWAEWGCRSCAHFVSWRCGIRPVTAREHVRIANRLQELPLIRAAFAEGA